MGGIGERWIVWGRLWGGTGSATIGGMHLGGPP